MVLAKDERGSEDSHHLVVPLGVLAPFLCIMGVDTIDCSRWFGGEYGRSGKTETKGRTGRAGCVR